MERFFEVFTSVPVPDRGAHPLCKLTTLRSDSAKSITTAVAEAAGAEVRASECNLPVAVRTDGRIADARQVAERVERSVDSLNCHLATVNSDRARRVDICVGHQSLSGRCAPARYPRLRTDRGGVRPRAQRRVAMRGLSVNIRPEFHRVRAAAITWPSGRGRGR